MEKKRFSQRLHGYWLVLFVVLALSACGYRISQMDLTELRTLAAPKMKYWPVISPPFDYTSFLRLERGAPELIVFIEGDGFAWRSRTEPSDDPTPKRAVMMEAALAQPAGVSVAYLARPCQFQRTAACHPRYWTNARFSPTVIKSMDNAISQLKQAAAAHRLHLVGYSGGGALAMLIAAQRSDVSYITTMAGVLDTDKWTRWHGVSRLDASENPADYAAKLASIPQRHFCGLDDDIVPCRLSHASLVGAQTKNLVPVEADHGCCWDRVWWAYQNRSAVYGSQF